MTTVPVSPAPLWYPAMDRWSDQTGIAHALSERSAVARPLCGARPYGLGGGFPSPSDAGCQPCPRCAAILARRAKLSR